MAKDTFYSISGGKWDDGWQNWIDGDGMVIREGVSGEITLKLILGTIIIAAEMSRLRLMRMRR